MTPRERFFATVNHREPDRLLVDYGKHIGSFHRKAYANLREHLPSLGGQPNARILDRMAQNFVLDDEVCRRLGIDFRWIIPHWVGVREIEVNGEQSYLDMWNTPHQFTEAGGYYAIADQPLGSDDLTAEAVEAFEWPDPEDPRMFEGLREQAKHWYENTDFVVGGDAVKSGILQTASQLRGYDKLFADFALNPELTNTLLDKLSSLINEMYRQYLKVVGPYLQVVVITDDQGTQNSLMVSPKMFRAFIKPRLKSLVDTIKETADVKVLMHCDGAILPIIDDLIEIGVDILNPIQTVVDGLEDTRALKEKYGDRICFHGAIDVQEVLPNATPEQVRQEVARRIQDLAPGGGYILAPCHNINTDISPANVIALFDAAQEFGRYPVGVR